MPSPSPPNSPAASPDPGAVMAEMMGFSSFGSKPNPKKKRKLHPTSPENSGSGSNSLPLGTGSRGKRKVEQARDMMKDDERVQVRGNEQGEKHDERDVEDDTVDDGGVPLPGPSSQILHPQLNQGVKDSDPILDSLTTKSQAKVLEERDNSAKSCFEKKASRVLADGLPLYININPARADPSVFPFQSSSQQLPIQSTYSNQTSQSQHGRQKHDFKSLRKGTRDEWGDMAYYDGSFVEDPWKGLW